MRDRDAGGAAPEHPSGCGAVPPPGPDSIESRCASRAPVPQNGRFPAGTVFGDWRLTAFIGRGGSGEVYCAEHIALGTPAAVKILSRAEDRAKERFAREAKLLAKMKSAAFPRFYAYGASGGVPYYAMELLEPGDPPAGSGEVARFMLGVCSAVAELHSIGFVHCDIKPGNILWRSPSEPVLADLGLAREADVPGRPDLSRQGHPATLAGAGTPGYGAPEQMERGEATAASDIHALGVLADTCFGGKPPRAWKRIIERATSSIPGRRYQTVRSLVRAIRWRNLPAFAMSAFAVSSAACAAVLCFSALRTPNRPAEQPPDEVEALRWRAMCSRGEIESVEERDEPVYPGRRYPATVRRRTNRVEGIVVRLDAKTNVFSRPVRLEPGEYRIAGPGRLDADLSGPTGVVVRLKDCILNNMTEKPYPDNGIRYILEDGAYLNFARMDGERRPSGLDSICDGAKNAIRFRGPLTADGLKDLQLLEEKLDWENHLKEIR